MVVGAAGPADPPAVGAAPRRGAVQLTAGQERAAECESDHTMGLATRPSTPSRRAILHVRLRPGAQPPPPGGLASRSRAILAQAMNPARKRQVRLVVFLTAALVLAAALAYTSFSSASSAVQPSQLLQSSNPGQSYQLTGKVVKDSVERRRESITFRVRDRKGSESVVVNYAGAVPDPFREGREVIIDVKRAGASREVFTGEKDTLVTKCPSKFRDSKTDPAGMPGTKAS